MKVVFAISQLGGGGAERVVALLSGKLASLGYETSVVTLLDEPVEYRLDDCVKYTCLRVPGNAVVRMLIGIRRLRSYIKQEKPDIMISFLPIANIQTILASRHLGCKVIVSERNDPYQNPRKKIVRVARDMAYKYANGYVFQTPDAMAYFDSIRRGKGVVIPNPVSDNLINKNIQDRRTAFVTAVRLEPQKNLKMLINGFAVFSALYPEYTLEIYGKGSLDEELRAQALSCGVADKVKIMGFASDLHQRIVDATAFVLTSDYEGISNSMIEAMALGLPVISTDHPIGGARMFIKNMENGILINVGATDELVEAMKLIASNGELAKRLSVAAKYIRDVLSLDNIVEQWRRYIHEVAE